MSPTPVTPRLARQHVVIIGGSSGIGYAIAALAESEGAQVTIMGRGIDRLKAAATGLSEATLRTVDLLQPDSMQAAFAGLAPIEHLVISAGTFSTAPISTSEPDAWRSVLEERIIGPLALIKACAPQALRSIVLFSGSVARRPFSGSCLLAAAACAIEGMTRELALELAPIRVNAVAPGLIDTPMTDAFLGIHKTNVFSETQAKLPVQRIGTAADAADAALFLMTNPYVTGSIIAVDGGSTLV